MKKANKNPELSPIEKAWDWNSTPVPEDGYDIEQDLKFVIGKNVMFKKDFNNCVKKLFSDLYKQIKHGDKEHKLWLKNKINDFVSGVK